MAAERKKNVLLVEDDKFLSTLLKNKLEKVGYDVAVVFDGFGALKYLKESKPDLVLLDIILPGISGFEVLKELQQDPQLKEAPVIIISNLGQETDIKTGLELGAIEYFVKAKTPIDQLIGKITEFLTSKDKTSAPKI